MGSTDGEPSPVLFGRLMDENLDYKCVVKIAGVIAFFIRTALYQRQPRLGWRLTIKSGLVFPYISGFAARFYETDRSGRAVCAQFFEVIP